MRDRALGSTVRLFFNSTNPDAGGAPVAPSTAFVAADIRIYKDGSATEKASAAGVTVTSPFDSVVGLHLVEIDTSNNTDAGFWTSGSAYSVRLVTATTVATYSVSGLLIGEISLELQTATLAAKTHTGAVIPTVSTVTDGAKSATALSTATWTGTLATNIGTTNTTVATNLDATVSSRSTYAGGPVASVTAAVELDSASIDAIWNEVLTGATHNIASSAGRRLRQLADTVVLVDGVCDAASNAGTDSTGTITLEVGTTTACVGQAIRSENQVRFIAAYDAGTRIAQLDRPWCVVPDAGDEYVIFNVRNPLVGLASLALAGSTAAVVNDVLVDTGTTLPAQIAPITDGIGWTLASLYGACANPQAADSLVQLTINGHEYSGQYAGLTATGVRTAPTLSKV